MCCGFLDISVYSYFSLLLFFPSISDHASSSAVNVSILDFERSFLLHLPKFKPKQVLFSHYTVVQDHNTISHCLTVTQRKYLLSPQVALCDGYVAVQAEAEVLVLKLEATPESETPEESSSASDPPKGLCRRRWNCC